MSYYMAYLTPLTQGGRSGLHRDALCCNTPLTQGGRSGLHRDALLLKVAVLACEDGLFIFSFNISTKKPSENYIFLFDPFEKQVDHGNVNQGLAMAGQLLIISGMPTKIHQPRQSALDDPTAFE